MTLELDTRGGSILNLFLNDYPVSLEQQEDKFQLMRYVQPIDRKSLIWDSSEK